MPPQMAFHIPSRRPFRRGKFLANKRAALDRRLARRHAFRRGQWTPSNLTNFPLADQPDSEIAQSGAVCDWHIKHEPSISDGCVDFDMAEWNPVQNRNFLDAEGTVSNSFLSGWRLQRRPQRHARWPLHGRAHRCSRRSNEAVQNRPDLSTADQGQAPRRSGAAMS